MFERFDNIPVDYIPTNICCLKKCKDNCIIIGADCDHIFDLAVPLNTIKAIQVIYKSGVEVFKVIDIEEDSIIDNTDSIFIKTLLSHEETALINPYLTFSAQIKVLTDIDIYMYSGIIKIKVIKTLDN